MSALDDASSALRELGDKLTAARSDANRCWELVEDAHKAAVQIYSSGPKVEATATSLQRIDEVCRELYLLDNSYRRAMNGLLRIRGEAELPPASLVGAIHGPTSQREDHGPAQPAEDAAAEAAFAALRPSRAPRQAGHPHGKRAPLSMEGAQTVSAGVSGAWKGAAELAPPALKAFGDALVAGVDAWTKLKAWRGARKSAAGGPDETPGQTDAGASTVEGTSIPRSRPRSLSPEAIAAITSVTGVAWGGASEMVPLTVRITGGAIIGGLGFWAAKAKWSAKAKGKQEDRDEN